MKIATIGLITLGLLSCTEAQMWISKATHKVDSNISIKEKLPPFSPKVEIYHNLTTIIPKDNTAVEEASSFNPNARNVTNYLLPKIKNSHIEINKNTTIDICGENTYIVAVGINRYKERNMKLRQAVNDAKNISKKIVSNCKSTQTHLLLDKDATKENILETFKKISKKATKKDNVIFFYSGYGFNYKNKNHIVAYDSKFDKEQPKTDSSITTKSISKLLKPNKIKGALMVFDACTTKLHSEK